MDRIILKNKLRINIKINSVVARIRPIVFQVFSKKPAQSLLIACAPTILKFQPEIMLVKSNVIKKIYKIIIEYCFTKIYL